MKIKAVLFGFRQASALTNVNKHEQMFAVNGFLRTVIISCMLILKFKRVSIAYSKIPNADWLRLR